MKMNDDKLKPFFISHRGIDRAIIDETLGIFEQHRRRPYIIGILIIGTGHMVVGRVARGILILGGAVAVGIVTFAINPVIFFIAIFLYWIFQLIDLSK